MLKHTTITTSIVVFLSIVLLVEFTMPFITPAQAYETKAMRKNARIFVPPANEPKFDPPIQPIVEESKEAAIEEIDETPSTTFVEESNEVENYYLEEYYEPIYYEPSYDYYYESNGLTPQSGVNYYDGRKETYYSSNVLYHKDTGNWSVDNEGFYRTDEGYYVVAASDMSQGTVFEGSQGTCIVLDTGCANGVTDYYVAW